MIQQYSWMSALGICIVFLLQAGCPTIIMEAGKKAFETRTTDDQVLDTKIGAGVLSRLSDKDKGLLLDVSSDTWEQRVLLTGTLDSPEIRDEVLALVKSDERIKQVYDEIQIVTPEEKERRRKEAEEQDKKDTEGTGQTVSDFWIATKIEAQLIGEPGIKSVNYRWRSVRNQVYLIGQARTQGELDKVLEICQGTKGVTSIKHFVEVKPVA
ncbi:MAG: BON domain-containing protein [Nitrospirales bacterium]